MTLQFEDVTRDDFESYIVVQQSGETNMFDIAKVEELSGLRKDIIKLIMINYAELCEKYGVDYE